MSWPMVKLIDVCEINIGKTPSRSNSKYWGNGHRWLSIADMNQGKWISNTKEQITDLAIKESGIKKVPANTVLFSFKLSIGKVCLSETDIYTNEAIAALPIKNKSQLDTIYLSHVMKTLVFSDMTDNAVMGATLNKKKLADIRIPLPSIEEQKRIAAILDKADSIRQNREQAIKLADAFLHTTFLEMFPHLEDSRNRVKLGDIVALDAPMVDPREEEYIDLIHIGPDRIEKNTGLLLPALTARDENLISKKFLFDESYVLYSKIRPYLKKCAIPDFSGLCSADMYPVKPIANKTNREFIWQLLLSDFFTKYTETLPDRANIPKLNRKELLNFEISLPPFFLQENYRAIVQKINNTKSIMRIQSNNDLLSRLTDKLFSKDQ
ncbi:restriction endonuclease subunit S [Pantoea sp. 1.19]|uniref:restriction endonuclease subunit S n=1 Tax=Pantoea sp. 1.19 TaxID=1925589 RepID=UPI001F0B15B4|nr:restriction endonuclease subunit S [Pantoea sp. 1.19]